MLPARSIHFYLLMSFVFGVHASAQPPDNRSIAHPSVYAKRLLGTWHFTEEETLKPFRDELRFKKDGSFELKSGRFIYANHFLGKYKVDKKGIVELNIHQKVSICDKESYSHKVNVRYRCRFGVDLAGNLMCQDLTEYPESKTETENADDVGPIGRVKITSQDDSVDYHWQKVYFPRAYENKETIRFRKFLNSFDEKPNEPNEETEERKKDKGKNKVRSTPDAQTGDFLDAVISSLTKEDQVARRALETLYEAEELAFPALLTRMHDKTVANSQTIHEAFKLSKTDLLDNSWDPKPTIGNVCFLIIRNQLEGGPPYSKNMRHFITRENVKEWIGRIQGFQFKTHQSFGLRSLQRVLLEQMIKQTCSRISKRGTKKFYLEELELLLSRQQAIRKSIEEEVSAQQMQLLQKLLGNPKSLPKVKLMADPKDFAVPPHALRNFSAHYLGGSIRVECDEFEEWIARTGHFGELASLLDKRPLASSLGMSLDDQLQARTVRVCDAAFQFIKRRYEFEGHVSYNHFLNDRNQVIQTLVNEIRSTHGIKKIIRVSDRKEFERNKKLRIKSEKETEAMAEKLRSFFKDKAGSTDK